MGQERKNSPPLLGNRLCSPDGTPWIGDESNGFWVSESSKDPFGGKLNPAKEQPKERSYWQIYGGGRPDLVI